MVPIFFIFFRQILKNLEKKINIFLFFLKSPQYILIDFKALEAIKNILKIPKKKK